jgi:group I intron endonuclease
MFNNIPLNQIYTNINEPSTICLIKKNLTKQIGIYSIVNNNEGKMYIGSSMNLAKRILEHINNKQSSIYLQNAISKYKLENFTLYILEFLCTDNNLSKTELNIQLIEMEQKYLDLFDNKYNINPTAGKSRIGAKHTEATRELMSKVRQENPYFLNKKHNVETIEKMRLRLSGSNNHMYGKPITEENKKLISKMFSKSIYLYDANTFKLINKYDKHKDIIKDLNISPKTLVKYKDSGKVFKDKYIWTSFEIIKE